MIDGVSSKSWADVCICTEAHMASSHGSTRTYGPTLTPQRAQTVPQSPSTVSGRSLGGCH
jgi:hypothetical protein